MTTYIDSVKIRFDEQATAPATPSTGQVVIYAKADGKMYRKDDTGAEVELGGGGFTSFTISATSGTPQTITDGNTITFVAAGGVTITASATDTITIDGSAFVQSITLAGSSGTPQTITNGNTISILATGGLTSVAGATDTITLDGSAFMQSFIVAGTAGANQTITNGNTLSLAATNGITITGSGTDTMTFDGLNAGQMILLASGSLSGVSSLSIASIPATYRHLRLYVYIRGGNAAADSLTLQLGTGGTPDTTVGNYSRNGFVLTGTTPTYVGDVGAIANLLSGATIGLTGAANNYASLIVDINNYANTSGIKPVQYTHGVSWGATAAEQKYVTGRGHWHNTAAVDVIGISSLLGSNFAAASVYSLYGIK